MEDGSRMQVKLEEAQSELMDLWMSYWARGKEIDRLSREVEELKKQLAHVVA